MWLDDMVEVKDGRNVHPEIVLLYTNATWEARDVTLEALTTSTTNIFIGKR